MYLNYNVNNYSQHQPSKEQAYNKFWELKDHFWKQFIDAKFHEYGPQVFDKGLHGGDIEPGFLVSLKQGCEFACEHLTEKLTVSFYKQLHKHLCTHFKGTETCTEISAEQAGMFRTATISCSFALKAMSAEAWKHYFFYEVPQLAQLPDFADWDYLELARYWFLHSYYNQRDFEAIKQWKLAWEQESNIEEKIKAQYPFSKNWVKQTEASWKSIVEEINAYIAKFCADESIDTFVHLYQEGQIIQLIYSGFYDNICEQTEQECSASSLSKTSAKIEKIVSLLFERYNHKMDALNSQLTEISLIAKKNELLSKKIEAIAELYQWLEWLHPFSDGQGRVDLVLQAKLLCEQGFNPAILEHPYLSSYSNLPMWSAYLAQGVDDWKAEVGRKSKK